ncbi:DUF72 domain-containing protein [Phenylobacterium sp. LH3H17]|uniref:DUF72 domain-containing protein n=1 Tax=Phenylobacterium sp. LH3H17 TaxID=2903901 RepID=UPI0020C9F90B|nr:DUF72 domain-containing protein [Phenylobacterium sp. LH3H17]UTP41036.1 DUF72 domain-containing protein [Phenylobacterium sp. LH3H17]
MTVRIGTAGWAIPRPVAPGFPAAGSILARYAQVFTAVEINSSFFRSHRRETYERWAASTPPGFSFSVKLPRTITHEARLEPCEGPLARFLNEVAGLGGKLGPILIQLPPSLRFEATGEAFIRGWRDRHSGPTVIEPRHPTWFEPQVEELLARSEVTRVAADPAVVPGAAEPGGWLGLTYTRLHGSPVMYASPYTDAALEAVAARLGARPGEAWCMFDNTRSGAAAADALRLLSRCKPGNLASTALETTADHASLRPRILGAIDDRPD